MNPLITIGITCFNSRDTILRALNSALSQDWENLEIIVVDDFSADDSATIVESAIADQKIVRLIRHEKNTGPGGSRNTILDNAHGEFVVFFDDDDESLPGRVRVQYETLREYENKTDVRLVACYASGVRRYPNGYELEVPAIGSQADIPKGELVADYLLFNDRKDGVFYGAGTPTCSLMARLSTFRALEGFDSSLKRVEDVDFAIRLALAGGHFIGCAQKLFIQYATFDSDKTPIKNLEAELRIVDKNAEYLRRRNRYDYARNWFRIRYYHFSGQRLKFLTALTIFLVRYPVSGARHLMRSFPGRWAHERSMRAKTDMTR